MRSGKLLVLCVIIVAGSVFAFGQADADLEQGIKPFGSFHGGNLDHVALFNGNLFLHGGVLAYSQRGGELAYPIVLRYNNENFSFFQETCPPGTKANQCPMYAFFGPSWEATDSSLGNAVTVGFEGLTLETSTSINTGLSFNGQPIYVDVASIVTPDGALHQLVNSNTGVLVTDGSGFYIPNGGNLIDRSGTKYGAGAEDRNGNQLSALVDTLGRQIPAMPGPVHPSDTPAASTASLSSCPALNYPNQPVTFAYTWNLPTVSGGTLPLVLCYAGVYVRTNFFSGKDPSFFHEVNQGFNMLQSVLFPDGTYWAFQYDGADPNNTASIGLADLLKVTLPTGGNISYTWGTRTGGSAISRAVQTRAVDANDGQGAQIWHYFYNQTQNTVVQDPAGNQTVHTLTGLGGTRSFYETQTEYFQGSQASGTLLKTVNTDYQFTPNPYDSSVVGGGSLASAKSVTNVFPIRVTTILPNGETSKVETDYDTALAYHGPLDGISYNVCTTDPDGMITCSGGTNGVTNYTGSFGKAVATREYEWGQGAPGPLLRQTSISYLWQTNSNYLNNNFLDLVSSVTTKDGAGNQVAQTTYGYDEYALNNSGVSTQHNASPGNGAVRGNLTSVHHWLNGSTVSTPNCPIAVSNGFLVSYTTYNDTGTVNKATDACGNAAGDPNHSTTFSYSSSFAGAYVTSATNAKGQTASSNYDFNTGLAVSQTDLNAQTTTSSYDSLWRPTQVNRPDGGQTTFCYTDTGGPTCTQSGAPFKVVVTRKIDSGRNEVSTSVVDGLGRKTETQLNSDPVCAAPGSKVDTAYDALGRVASVTNPFCSTSDTTYGVTTSSYDALGRSTQVTHPDGTSVVTTYSNRAVEVTDEGNGTRSVQRISQADGLGRLQSVCEVSSTTLSFGSGATPAACGLDIAATSFLTTYGYDTLGDLTSVSQGGYMPRAFTYDSLSRLASANNPESGTMSYAYDAAGNVITKTDARNITTTYAYDVLHRLLSKSYSDGTPTASFVYDVCPAGGCPSGVTPQLTVGRMVESSTPNARTFLSYDPMGRDVNQWQCTPVNCGSGYYALSYGYDKGGDLTSATNGFGVTLSSAYDTASRLTGVTSNLSDSGHPANLLSGIQYNALGMLAAESLGNGASETLAYDTRMRLTSLTASSPTAIGATAGTGTVTVNGSERSYQNPAATATAHVSISGEEHSYQQCTRNFGCVNVYDSGKVFISVNGHEYDYFFSGSDTSSDTASSVAAGVVAAIQADGARVVNASCSDGACTTPTITLTALSAGSAGNSISFTSGYTYQSQISQFASQGPSFTASPASGSLSGGQNAWTTYDTGTVSITVNGVQSSVSYGSGSSANSVASALAGALTSGTLVNATASGNAVTITSKTTGSASNYSLAASSSSSNGFSPVSFTGSASGASLTGGSGASPGTIYSFSMTYAPNSNVLTANDSANGNWTYGYDDFNRLVASNKNAGQQTYSYLYDRFGNRWQQNAPQGGSVFLATFTGGNNRLDGASHDAAGNMITDPTTGATYTYDAENRITQVNGGSVTYTYDADGQRVEKNVGGVKTDYVYDLGGHAIAEINGSGTVTREELFAGGKHLGTYLNNTTYFSHGDWLGTERVRSDMTGAACETVASLPFGDGQATSGSCGDPSTRHFTGKERDTETGLDYFRARYYSNSLGRFISADWSAIPVPVPYADLTDPQTLNLYAYVGANPVSKADPNGHGPLDWLKKQWAKYQAWQAKEDEEKRKSDEKFEAEHEKWRQQFIKENGFDPDQAMQGFVWAYAGIQTGFGYGPEPEPVTPVAEEEAPVEVTVSRSKSPAAAHHVDDAQAVGKPSVVTLDRSGTQGAARAAARGRAATSGTPTAPQMDRDEYPPKCCAEGGKGASVRSIPSSDNRSAGGQMSSQTKTLPDGTKIKIKTGP